MQPEVTRQINLIGDYQINGNKDKRSNHHQQGPFADFIGQEAKDGSEYHCRQRKYAGQFPLLP